MSREARLFDAEREAAEAMIRLYKCCETAKERAGREAAGGTRREPSFGAIAVRVADLAQLVAQIGVFQAAAFMLSKSSDELDHIGALLELLSRDDGCSEKAVETLLRQGGGEGKGYPIALALLLHGLRRLAEEGLVPLEECRFDGGVDPASIARCIKSLRGEPGRAVLVERLLTPYLTVCKRFADAFFKRER